MTGVIRDLLQAIIDKIDAGNSHITEDQAVMIADMLKPYTLYEPYTTAAKAHTYLGINMKTFRNLIKTGELPKGIKEAGDSSLKWLKTDIINYSNKTGKKNKFGFTLDSCSWKVFMFKSH